MAEGGTLPWKRQKIDTSRGPPADYTDLLAPLPNPPRHTKWTHDEESGEWKLIPTKERAPIIPASGKKKATALLINGKVVLDDSVLSPLPKKPTGQVEGVDYAEHTILPTDTFQGICLAYGISAHKLRQANRFSGSNLLLAPSKLIIPLTAVADPSNVRKQDTESHEYKIHAVRADVCQLSRSEAKAYLEMSDWNVDEAVNDAREDLRWEKSTALTPNRLEDTMKPLEVEPHKDDLVLDVHVAVPLELLNKARDENMETNAEEKTGEALAARDDEPFAHKETTLGKEFEMKSLMTPLLNG